MLFYDTVTIYSCPCISDTQGKEPTVRNKTMIRIDTGSFPGKINQEPKKIKNCVWQCVIYHIKEQNLKFNVQKKLNLLLPEEKTLQYFEVK